MGAVGAFTFVLHSHLPYARLAGRWPHGEEWIHEAATETYIPLLRTLYDLKNDGISFKLTIGLTPILAEQLDDPLVLEHLEQYLQSRTNAAISDMNYYAGPAGADSPTDFAPLNQISRNTILSGDTQHFAPEAEPHLCYLAEWYRDWYRDIHDTFVNRLNRDIIGAFRRLQDEGYIEIITSAATHAYLPLLSKDSMIRAQIQIGIESYRRLFGRSPEGFWLPECAYRPAFVDDEGNVHAGMETFLAEHGIKVFFSETHTITGGQPVGVAAGDVIGPYGNIKRRYVIPTSPVAIQPKRDVTTFHPYYVIETIKGTEAESHSGVIVIGRNNRTGQQVWSADWGYPGDFDYREFHKKAGTSGLQYWRVTGAKTDLGNKDYYHPDWAAFKIDQHAEHFANLVCEILQEHHNETGEFGLIASNYDTELFGHWWFEGAYWLGKVLRHLAANPAVELTTASGFVHAHPPTQVLSLPEGSWGAGGTHFTWNNGEVNWMWEPIHVAEAKMTRLAQEYTDATSAEALVLNQAARELLLVQSSDWPFLITTGQAREYAIQRYNQHLERFNRLAESVERGQPDTVYAEEIYELDKIFPDIDFRCFIPEP